MSATSLGVTHFESLSSQNAANSRRQYDILLHAINHEDNQGNIERHVLVLDKWIRENGEGFLVRDLQYIIQIFPILRARLSSHYSMFREILKQVVKTAAKPLLESRSSERLKPESMMCIKEFYREFSLFYAIPELQNSIEMTKSFRCVIQGGRDPYVLKADTIAWEGDGTKIQVTDAEFLQTMIRDGQALDNIVNEFMKAMDVVGSGVESLDAKSITSVEMNPVTDDIDARSVPAGVDASGSSEIVAPAELTQAELQEWIISCLDLLFDICANPISAGYMCKSGVCRGAIIFLNEYAARNFRNPKVSQCVDLIWTCLEGYLDYADVLLEGAGLEEALKIEVLDFEFACYVLKDVVFKIIHQGYRLADKELRNELVIVLTIIAKFPRAIPCFTQSGLINMLLTYCTVAECGKLAWTFYMQPIAKIRNFGSVFEIDLHLKRKMWVLVSDAMKSDDEDILTAVAASPFIELLLIYLEKSSIELPHHEMGYHHDMLQVPLDTLLPKAKTEKEFSGLALQMSDRPGTTPDGPVEGETSTLQNVANIFLGTLSVAQLKEFQVIAVVLLAENAEKVLGEFLRIDGPLRVLQLIHLYKNSPLEEHKSIIYHAMILLNRIVLALPSVVKPILEYQEIIKVLLDIFNEFDDEYIRAQAARLISNLCNGSKESILQLRNMDGTSSLIGAIVFYTESRRVQVGKKAGIRLLGETAALEVDEEESKPGGDLSIFIVSVLDCLQNGIVGTTKNENRFAQEEGIDALLNLVEVSPFLLRLKVLRLLSGLLENSQLISFCHAWRSNRTMRSAAQIMCHCWMDEEVRLGVPRNNGMVTNLLHPLAKHAWPDGSSKQDFPSLTESVGGSSFENSEVIGTVEKDGGTMGFSTNESQHTKRQRGAVNVQPGHISLEVRQRAMENDTRVVLARILELMALLDRDVCFANPLGGDDMSQQSMSQASGMTTSFSELGLTPQDKQVISIAKRFDTLKCGEFWREVYEDLASSGTTLIDSDQAKIQYFLKEYFNAASIVSLEQSELSEVEREVKREESDDFINKILDQKQQQIKAEWIKRNAKKKTKSSLSE